MAPCRVDEPSDFSLNVWLLFVHQRHANVPCTCMEQGSSCDSQREFIVFTLFALCTWHAARCIQRDLTSALRHSRAACICVCWSASACRVSCSGMWRRFEAGAYPPQINQDCLLGCQWSFGWVRILIVEKVSVRLLLDFRCHEGSRLFACKEGSSSVNRLAQASELPLPQNSTVLALIITFDVFRDYGGDQASICCQDFSNLSLKTPHRLDWVFQVVDLYWDHSQRCHPGVLAQGSGYLSILVTGSMLLNRKKSVGVPRSLFRGSEDAGVQ